MQRFRSSSLGRLFAGGALVLAVGCGGVEAEAERQDLAREETQDAGERLAPGGEGRTSRTDAGETEIPGFVRLEPSCPFPYRLQYPAEWTLEGDVNPIGFTLDAGSERSFTLKREAEEGSVHKEGLSRAFEASPEVEKPGEITVGGESVTVYATIEPGRRESKVYTLWVPATRVAGATMWTRLRAITMSDSEDTIDPQTVLRILDTLEWQECD